MGYLWMKSPPLKKQGKLKESRRGEVFSIKSEGYRRFQDDLFREIVDRLKDNGFSPSMFNHQSSEQVVEKLASLKIFTEEDLASYKAHLSEELDASPYWL